MRLGHDAKFAAMSERPTPADNLGPIPDWITPELMAETRRVWQPYYKEELTDAEVLALLLRVGSLYEMLFEEADYEEESDDENEDLHRPRPS